MPNRILKESICISDSIEHLSWFEEVVFYRLIVNCDDYGRIDGRLPILKSKLFPLKDVREKAVSDAVNKLSATGMVCIYSVNGKPYLQLVTWGEHQQIRNQKSKYPDPDSGRIVKRYEDALKSSDIKCNQLKSNVPVIQSNPIQSESKSKSESECMLRASSEPTPSVISLILNDKSLFGISQSDIDHWKELYPSADVLQELKKMQGWLEANPQKRKTKTGILRFITSWLSREQDKGSVAVTAAKNEIEEINEFKNYGGTYV